MTRLYLALLAALLTAHAFADVSTPGGVLTALACVVVCAVVDLGAVIGRRVRGAVGKSAVRP